MSLDAVLPTRRLLSLLEGDFGSIWKTQLTPQLLSHCCSYESSSLASRKGGLRSTAVGRQEQRNTLYHLGETFPGQFLSHQHTWECSGQNFVSHRCWHLHRYVHRAGEWCSAPHVGCCWTKCVHSLGHPNHGEEMKKWRGERKEDVWIRNVIIKKS